jgi:HlyD family secretion protein
VNNIHSIRCSYGITLGILLLMTGLSSCNGENTTGLVLSGTVEAREAALGFQVNGRIEQLLVDEGERVSKGQEIARIADADYVLAVNRASAEVDAVKAALAALEAGTRSQELKVAEATLDQARAEQRFAESEVKRLRSLVTKKAASQEQLDQAEMQLDVAHATVSRAKQQLLLLQEGPRQEAIDQARAELAAHNSALHSAEQQLAYVHLYSPVDGTVTLRHAEAGEVVAAGQPVFTVAELTQPWVRAYLNESHLGSVRLGQKVTVRVDGVQDKTFPGSLSFISDRAEFTPKSVETRELRVDLVYRIKVQLDDPDGILKLGMPADVIFDDE